MQFNSELSLKDASLVISSTPLQSSTLINSSNGKMRDIWDRNSKERIISKEGDQIIISAVLPHLDFSQFEIDSVEMSIHVIHIVFKKTIYDKIRKCNQRIDHEFSFPIDSSVKIDLAKGYKKTYENNILKIFFQKEKSFYEPIQVESGEIKDLANYSYFKKDNQPVGFHLKKNQSKKCIIS